MEQSSRSFRGCISVNVEKVIDLFIELAALPPLVLPQVNPNKAWNDRQSCDEQSPWSYSETYVYRNGCVRSHVETRNGAW